MVVVEADAGKADVLDVIKAKAERQARRETTVVGVPVTDEHSINGQGPAAPGLPQQGHGEGVEGHGNGIGQASLAGGDLEEIAVIVSVLFQHEMRTPGARERFACSHS